MNKELEIDVYDYEFHRSMREQNERRSRKYLFLRLELFEYLKRYRNKYNYDDKEPHYKGNIYRTMYCRRLSEKVNNYYDCRNATNKKYDEKNGFVIKIRVVEKTLNYAGLNRRYYDATNIKHFDPTTFKTSNKGLKADTTWTYTTNDRTAGWTFGGIDAKDMERFAVKNGFKKEKGEKYVYGDYAIWILRTLV